MKTEADDRDFSSCSQRPGAECLFALFTLPVSNYYLARRTIGARDRDSSSPRRNCSSSSVCFFYTQFQYSRRVTAGYTPSVPWISHGARVISQARQLPPICYSSEKESSSQCSAVSVVQFCVTEDAYAFEEVARLLRTQQNFE